MERTAEIERARYQDLSPAKAAPLIGADSAAHVRKLILTGQLEARDVGAGDVARYKISMRAIEKFNKRARQKVLDRVEKRKQRNGTTEA